MLRIAVTAVLYALVACAPAAATTTVRIENENPTAYGDEAANHVTVSPLDGGREFAFDDPAGAIAGPGCTQVTPTRATCPRVAHPTECDGDVCMHAIEAVHVTTFGGDDEVRVGYGEAAAGWPQSHALVDAGPGNDFVGGSPVVDYDLRGGPGHDVIDGAGFNDRVHGGGGRDRLYGGPGFDTLEDGDHPGVKDGDLLDGGPCPEPICAAAGPLEPGDAEDVASYERRTAPITVDLRSDQPVQGEPGEGDTLRGIETVYGGRAADHLIMGDGARSLSGGDGDDTLEALGLGRDFVNCGDGIDIVVAADRDELVECESDCPRLAGCPRPRLTISGVPKCARRPFTATIRVRGLKGFERMTATLDGERIGRTRRSEWRLRIPIGQHRGYAHLEIVVKGRRWMRISRELNTCRPLRP